MKMLETPIRPSDDRESHYIDRDDLIEKATLLQKTLNRYNVDHISFEGMFKLIEMMPARTIEPIRCRDCAHWTRLVPDGYNSCDVNALLFPADHYCAFAEPTTTSDCLDNAVTTKGDA